MAERKAKGGMGGSAFVDGKGSRAEGGRGGDGVLGDGGNGGNAAVLGNHISVKGGKGGRGGIGPGQPGTTIAIIQSSEVRRDPESEEAVRRAAQDGQVMIIDWEPPYLHMEGGQGGEAPQQDGRGGRGGRSPRALLGAEHRHMRRPYFVPADELPFEPGRGGDGLDTPQYMARRIILEHLKRCYFAERGMDWTKSWWDRDVVPMSWLNSKLLSQGHLWQATIVDDEYEFSELLHS